MQAQTDSCVCVDILAHVIFSAVEGFVSGWHILEMKQTSQEGDRPRKGSTCEMLMARPHRSCC